MEKGEIAHYEQFLLFPWCFQNTGKRLKLFSRQSQDFQCFGKGENVVGKDENAGYQHFSFYHNVFKRPQS